MSEDDKIIPIRPPEDEVAFGGPVDRVRITLGVYGDELEPDEISFLLQCKPTTSFRRGDSTGHGTWGHGAWLLEVEDEAPAKVEDLLMALLARVPTDPSVWETLRRRFKAQVLIGLHNEALNRTFALPPPVLEQIVRMGVSIYFDLWADCFGYDDDDDDDEDEV